MAKSSVKLPDPLARRHLLEGELEADKALAYGEAYLEAGREVEAVDFLARSNSQEALQGLRRSAAERGDVFLMRIVCRGLGEEPTSAEWADVAAAAESRGRLSDAETARRLASVGD